MYVANFLVEPAIRPLEGILKIALQENGFPIRKEDKDYDTFFVFKEKEFGYVIKEQFLENPPSKEIVSVIDFIVIIDIQCFIGIIHWARILQEL